MQLQKRGEPHAGLCLQYGLIFKLGALALGATTVAGLIRLGPELMAHKQWALLGFLVLGSGVYAWAILEAFLNRTFFGDTSFSHRSTYGRTESHSYGDIEHVIRHPQKLTLVLKDGKRIKVFSQQGDLDRALHRLRAKGLDDRAVVSARKGRLEAGG